MEQKRIFIGSDHGGFNLKKIIIERLKERGYEVTDIGSDHMEIVRYPYYAARVAAAVSLKTADRGVLICSTGLGMSIVANKFPGVRASLCTSTFLSKMTRLHNDSNILCLGGRMTGDLEALDILDTWLDTPYEGGRHAISLSLIEEIEAGNCDDTLWESGRNTPEENER